MAEFTLQASNISGPLAWKWTLLGEGGMFVADHAVSLADDDWRYKAFLDLHGYLRVYASPDRRREAERQMIEQVGRWIGEQVLGPTIGAKLAEAAKDEPVVVHVVVDRGDADAEDNNEDHILYRPLELAYAGDRPLALQEISLVFGRPQPDQPPRASVRLPPHGDGPLRMLAVFSLPLDVGALNLRHERYELRQMIRRIVADRGLDFDLRVLQYGVTRDALKRLLRDGPGWDIVHFSGHGLAARLVLETDDGRADKVETADLVDLLRPTRKRLKWVTFSSCLSAAATVDETLRWLGLEPARDAGEDAAASDNDNDHDTTVTARRLPMLADRLARELDCAVLAMRFPVGDRFAIDLGGKLYEGVFGQRQSLDRALQLALPELVGKDDAAYPPLSVGTPALFGGRAAGLRFDPRRRDAETVEVKQSGLALFPPPEPRLVGRVDQLSRAGRALASGGEYRGVLLHGMAGAGKTACAKELAWSYEDVERFQYFVWYKAPDVGQDIGQSLVNLAKALEDQIPGLQMIQLMDRRDELLAFLPRLSDMLRRYSVLVVLDNLESLLTPLLSKEGLGEVAPILSKAKSIGAPLLSKEGLGEVDQHGKKPPLTPPWQGGEPEWREPAWGDVIDAMLMHDGESRVVLTSRTVPPVGVSEFARHISPARGQIDAAAKLLTLPVHALSLDEAALLARQLQNLGGILEGRHADGGIEADRHRHLVTRMLRLVQGHPKLIDLAERQATGPAALAEHLDRAESASLAGEAPLAAFFDSGQSALTDDDFLATLTGWTDTIAAGLSADASRLFGFTCCLEEADRERQIVEAVWPRFLRRIESRRVRARTHQDDDEQEVRASTDPTSTTSLAELLSGIDPNDLEALAKLLENPLVKKQLEQRVQQQATANQSLAASLDELYRCGLVERRGGAELYGIHPGVAEAGRLRAGAEVQAAVDAELGAFWVSNYRHGIKTEMQGGGGLIRLAGQRAAPYLIRGQQWETASTLLERVLQRDKSAATVAAVLPLLRHIAAATAGTTEGLENEGVLANALLDAGRWQEAETMMLDIADRAVRRPSEAVANDGSQTDSAASDGHRTGFRIAGTALGSVINIMMATGRSEEALDVVERKKQATKSAGLGPWTQLGDDAWRLQLLNDLGRHDEVLAEVERLRPVMAALPEDTGQQEAVVTWNVREGVLGCGREAAVGLNRWEDALAINAEAYSVKQSRNANELELARTRYNDYGPLLRLKRFGEARELLLDCRRVFEEHQHYEMLGKVIGALANLEKELGHPDRAAAAEQDALRYTYLVGDPGDCAISHFNLANYLRLILASSPSDLRQDAAAADAIAHRLAAVCISYQTQHANLPDPYGALRIVINELPSNQPDRASDRLSDEPWASAQRLIAPDGSGFDRVVEIVERIPGVRFGELFSRLPTTRAADGPSALAAVLALAAEQPEAGA